MDARTIQARIKRTLVNRFELGLVEQDIGDTEALFEGGLGLDSSAALELVVGVEEAFGIVIRDEDMVMENFKTVDRLVRLVEARLAQSRRPEVSG